MPEPVAQATVKLIADTRGIEDAFKRLEARGLKINFNSRNFSQPLGRISGEVNEFTRSLEAANSRVIAFAASASVLYGVQRGFRALLGSAVEVEKSLKDINVILNANTNNLKNFGDQLFKIARDTGQTFQTAAKAATEFSRQGLGLNETLKRTKDALVLARLSGQDVVSSVESITAALNSFNKSVLDSTTLINKLATVDAAFAVSTGDLSEALKRVGSAAQDAGVGIDELIALVTATQQTTARGGAVIGNSFKTIFTRVQRTDVLDQLEALGVAARDLQGNTLPAIKVLQNLATTYDKLSDSQRSQVSELVGGVYQINILKASLGDLSKQYSNYNNALNISANATDAAIRRSEELNKTLSALANSTLQNLIRVGAKVGENIFGPTARGVLGITNNILGDGRDAEQEGASFGEKIGEGITKGIGQFLSGPGLFGIAAILGKILNKFASQAIGDIKTLTGLNKVKIEQQTLEKSINNILSLQPNIIDQIIKKNLSLLELQKLLTQEYQKQTSLSQTKDAVSSIVAFNLLKEKRVTVDNKTGNVTATRRAAKGLVPNFEAGDTDTIIESIGAYNGGYKPGKVKQMHISGLGKVTYNDAEQIKSFPGLSQPAIIPPKNSEAGRMYKDKFEKKLGFNPYANKGLVPNYAEINQKDSLNFFRDIITKKGRIQELVKKYPYLQNLGLENFNENLDLFRIIKLRQNQKLRKNEDAVSTTTNPQALISLFNNSPNILRNENFDIEPLTSLIRKFSVPQNRIIANIPKIASHILNKFPNIIDKNIIDERSGKFKISELLAIIDKEQEIIANLTGLKSTAAFAFKPNVRGLRKFYSGIENKNLRGFFNSGKIPNFASKPYNVKQLEENFFRLVGDFGYADLTRLAGTNTGKINNISVSDFYRGKGVSNSIYTDIFDFAQGQGINTIIGDLLLQNNTPKDPTKSLSILKAALPQLIRGRFGASNTLGIGRQEFNLRGGEKFDVDLERMAGRINSAVKGLRGFDDFSLFRSGDLSRQAARILERAGASGNIRDDGISYITRFNKGNIPNYANLIDTGFGQGELKHVFNYFQKRYPRIMSKYVNNVGVTDPALYPHPDYRNFEGLFEPDTKNILIKDVAAQFPLATADLVGLLGHEVRHAVNEGRFKNRFFDDSLEEYSARQTEKSVYEKFRKKFGDGINLLGAGSKSNFQFKNRGLIPNYFPQISRAQAAQLIKNNRQSISSLTYDSASLGRPVEVNGLQWSSAVRHDLKTGTRPGNVERQKRGEFLTLRGKFDGAKDYEIKNITLDKIRQIRAQGEIFDVLNRGLVPNYAFEQIGKFRQPQQSRLKYAQEQLQKSGLFLKDYNIPINYLGRNPSYTGGYLGFTNPFRTKPGINIYSGAHTTTYLHEYGHFIDNLMGVLQGGGKFSPSEAYSGFSKKSYFSEFNRGKLEQLFKRKYTDKYPDNPLEDFADAFAHIIPSGRVVTTGTSFEAGYDFINNNLQQFFKQYNSGRFGSFSDILNKFKAQTKIVSPLGNDKIKTAIHTGIDFNVPGFPTYFSSGYTPNFNQFLGYGGLNQSIEREKAAGIPSSQIRVGQSPKLKSAENPLGLGVYNTKDEPLGLNQGISRYANMGLNPKKAGIYNKGLVPNYANGDFKLKSSDVDIASRRLTNELLPKLNNFLGQIQSNTSSFDKLEPQVNSLIKEFKLTAASASSVRGIFRQAEINRPGTAISALQAGLSRQRGLAGNELVRTGLKPLSPLEALRLSVGSIQTPQQPKLLNAPQTGFQIIPSNKGFRGNLLNAPKQPAGLLGQGRVIIAGAPDLFPSSNSQYPGFNPPEKPLSQSEILAAERDLLGTNPTEGYAGSAKFRIDQARKSRQQQEQEAEFNRFKSSSKLLGGVDAFQPTLLRESFRFEGRTRGSGAINTEIDKFLDKIKREGLSSSNELANFKNIMKKNVESLGGTSQDLAKINRIINETVPLAEKQFSLNKQKAEIEQNQANIIARQEERKIEKSRQTEKRISDLQTRASQGRFFGLFADKEAENTLERLSRRNSETGALANSARINARQTRGERLQNAAFLGSIAAPIITSTATEFIGQDTRGARLTGTALGGLGDVASFASLGAVAGPKGALIGAGVGAGVGILKFIKAFGDKLPELSKNLQDSGQILSKVSDSFGQLNQLAEQFIQISSEDIKVTPRQEQNLFDKLNSIIARLPKEKQEEALKAVKTGNIPVLSDLSAQIVNPLIRSQQLKTLSIDLEQFRQKPNNFTKLQGNIFGEFLLSLQGKSGSDLFNEISKNPDLLSKVKNLPQLEQLPSTSVPSDIGFVTKNLEFPEALEKQTKQIQEIINLFKEVAPDLAEPLNELFLVLISKDKIDGINSLTKTFKDLFNNVTKTPKFSKQFGRVFEGFEKESARFLQSQIAPNFQTSLSANFQASKFSNAIQLRESQQRNEESLIENLLNPEAFIKFNSQNALSLIGERGNLSRSEFGNQFRETIFEQLKSIPGQLNLPNDRQAFELFKNINTLNKIARETNFEDEAGSRNFQEQLGFISFNATKIFSKADAEKFNFLTENIRRLLEERAINLEKINDTEETQSEITKENERFQKSLLRLNERINFGGGRENIINPQNIFSQFATTGLFNLRSQNPNVRLSGLTQQSEILKSIGVENALAPEIQKELEPLIKQFSEILGGTLEESDIKNIAKFQSGFKFEKGSIEAIQLAESFKKLNTSTQNLSDDKLKRLGDIAVKLGISFERIKTASEQFQLDLLRQNKGIFSEDAAQQQLNINRKKILESGGNLSINELKDLTTQSFLDPLKYETQDLYKDIIEGAYESSNALKQGFKDAFSEFANGTTDAIGALKKLGLAFAENLFNKSLNIGTNLLFDALGSKETYSAIGNLFKADGGYIKKYARGGTVQGGSGIRDDVPALLQNGEYVVKKSAVNKYGEGFLNYLNNGGVARYASGGGVNLLLDNRFEVDSLQPTNRKQGRAVIDPNLSILALEDENNPQNAIRESTRESFENYIKSKEEALKAFERAKSQRRISALINVGTTIAGGYLSGLKTNNLKGVNAGLYGLGNIDGKVIYGSRGFGDSGLNFGNFAARGGLATYDGFKKYGFGGINSTDNIPALLTGGEYVVNKNTVDRYGVDFFNKINNSRIPNNRIGYAEGGIVGGYNSVSPIGARGEDKMTEAINRLIETLENNTDAYDKKANKQNNKLNRNYNTQEGEVSQNNPIFNISINVDVKNDGTAKTTTTAQQNGNSNQTNNEQAKQFSERIRAVVIDEIIKQRNIGGLLQNTR